MVCKSQQDRMPDYITAHLTEYMSPRPLRLSEDKQLVVINSNFRYGDLSYIIYPQLSCGMWHLFHSKNRQFQEAIVTYLFKLNL